MPNPTHPTIFNCQSHQNNRLAQQPLPSFLQNKSSKHCFKETEFKSGTISTLWIDTLDKAKLANEVTIKYVKHKNKQISRKVINISALGRKQWLLSILVKLFRRCSLLWGPWMSLAVLGVPLCRQMSWWGLICADSKAGNRVYSDCGEFTLQPPAVHLQMA